MRKLVICVALAVSFVFIFPAGQAIAGPDVVTLNWGKQLNASDTACPSGKKVLSVVRKVTNSLDSGTGSNDAGYVWWAYIDYVQQIQVVQTGTDVTTGKDLFCATVKSQGSFESVAGDGPGCENDGNCDLPDGRLEAGVVGTFQGGMTNTFKGTFTPGSLRTNGNIGTLDHACNAASSAGCTVPGFSAWRSDYFTGVTGSSLDRSSSGLRAGIPCDVGRLV